MMAVLMEMLSYPFLVRALVGGLCIALCASLLGVSLVDVYKRQGLTRILRLAAE